MDEELVYAYPSKAENFPMDLCSSKLLTNVQRSHRRLTGNSSCKHCVGIPETMLHLFRDCPKARLIWSSFNIPTNMLATFTLDWDGWLFANLMQNGYHIHNLSWNVFFVFCCWFIWKWRCKSIFDDRYQYPYNPADIILGYATDWTKAMAKPNMQLLKHVKNLSWIGFYKLNVDGSRSRNGDIGAGGVTRDGSGCWKNGFMINIGSGDVLQAEAWGLFYGIQLALDMQISNLEVESDSAVLINLLQNYDSECHPLGTIDKLQVYASTFCLSPC